MSFLVVAEGHRVRRHGQGLAGGWDIFGTKARESRKEKVALSAASFQEKMALKRYEQERAAIETFRTKISNKLVSVEAIAAEAAQVIEQVRRVAEDPILSGDPILTEVDAQLADFEEGLVQIQAGTVVDTATFDTHRLAISYSDAQAALIGMTSLKTRAVGILEDLRSRIKEVGAEKVREAEAFRKQQILAEQEGRRQETLRQQLEFKQKESEQEQRRASQEQLFDEHRRLGTELAAEKRVVAGLRRQIDLSKRRREEGVARKAATAAKLAALRSAGR